MYSGNFHYGDMLIPLVAIATFENYKNTRKNFLVLEKNRILIGIPIFCILFNMPASLSQVLIQYFQVKRTESQLVKLSLF